MGERVPGVEGLRPLFAGERSDTDQWPGRAKEISPVTGLEAPIPLTTDRIITAVTKDWEPPSPRVTPETVVRGRTLEAVAADLSRLSEWGEGGGMLRVDRVPVGKTASVTVVGHANLVFRLPRWANYATASTAAKAEWDRMMGFLRAHEQRHLDIAIEEANNLASELIGQEIGQIASLVTAANGRMNTRQMELDASTNNGSRAGVPYGDVTLDLSIE